MGNPRGVIVEFAFLSCVDFGTGLYGYKLETRFKDFLWKSTDTLKGVVCREEVIDEDGAKASESVFKWMTASVLLRPKYSRAVLTNLFGFVILQCACVLECIKLATRQLTYVAESDMACTPLYLRDRFDA